MFFADTFAISAASVLAYSRTLRATRHRPRSVSTKTIQPPDPSRSNQDNGSAAICPRTGRTAFDDFRDGVARVYDSDKFKGPQVFADDGAAFADTYIDWVSPGEKIAAEWKPGTLYR